MAFRSVNFAHLAKFNSAASSEFIDFYESILISKINQKLSEPSSQTFAPSSFRCSRKQWFRLRGVQPDKLKSVDLALNFTAELGTACHKIIQTNLKESMVDDWLSVSDYLADNPIPYNDYRLSESEDGLETKIEIINPPIHFACDGIIRWKDTYYLLEIKTSEYSSFNELTDPKSIHVDQVKCYATLLGLSNVLMLYQDRQYGGLKCYELTVSESDKHSILNKIADIQAKVGSNIAPDKLQTGDTWCNQCEYAIKCKEWG